MRVTRSRAKNQSPAKESPRKDDKAQASSGKKTKQATLNFSQETKKNKPTTEFDFEAGSLPEEKGMKIKGFQSQEAGTLKKGQKAKEVKPKKKAQATEEEDDYKEEVEEDILKDFDFNGSYGPQMGLTRMQRWKNAKRLNLNPPITVYKILKARETRREKDASSKKDESKISSENEERSFLSYFYWAN